MPTTHPMETKDPKPAYAAPLGVTLNVAAKSAVANGYHRLSFNGVTYALSKPWTADGKIVAIAES